jgi:hypothetical protein
MPTDLLGNKLEQVPLESPVLIAGLARTGSTILLNLFSRLPNARTGTAWITRESSGAFEEPIWMHFLSR